MKKKEIGQCEYCTYYEKVNYINPFDANGLGYSKIGRCERKKLPYKYLPEIVKGCWHWKEKRGTDK